VCDVLCVSVHRRALFSRGSPSPYRLRPAASGPGVCPGKDIAHHWRFYPAAHRDEDHAPLEEFQRQSRDLFIPVGDVGFWQGAFCDTAAAGYQEARIR